ncbi:MAG: hypothetical protein R3B06_28035 [Kofleriaceae bacterium]
MEPPAPSDRRRLGLPAVVLSLVVHGVLLQGLRCGARPPQVRTPPAFAIDIAPTPRQAEALPPEQALAATVPAPAPAATDPIAPAPVPPAAPDGFGLVDAGVDALVVDAGAPPDARRRRDAGPDAAAPPDAGADAPAVATADGDAGVDAPAVATADGDAGGAGDLDAGALAAAGDGGVPSDGGGGVALGGGDGDAGAGGDGGVATAGPADGAGAIAARPSDGTAADLRVYFPAGHIVSVLVRLDRLRDTEWAPQVDKVFAPMPDYRSLVGDSQVALVDSFETLAISTPAPRDAAATTLVVRARLAPPVLRDLLDAPDAPVAWTPVVGGVLGRRQPSPRVFAGDRRVFLQWRPGWTALAQPRDLGGLLAPRAGALDVAAPADALPAWLDQVGGIEAVAGEPTGPALIATAAGVFPARLPIPYGSGADLPGPDRATVTLEIDARGFHVAGNVRFPDEAAAAAAADTIARLRAEILDDTVTAFALGQAGALNAIKGLTLQRTGRRLAFATSLSIRDARALLVVVATLVDTYFKAAAPPP